MRLRLNTRHHSQPEGGWSYPIPDGPNLSSDKVGEPGLRDLIGQLGDYRRANGFPVGDPEHDIAMHYAPTTPWLIIEEMDDAEAESAAERWIHMIWRSFPQPLAEGREREDRFAQCELCTHFQPLDTIVLTQEAERRLMLLNPAKSRKDNGWCRFHKWIPSVVVQIQNPQKFTEQTSPSPECWLHFPNK